MRNFKKVLFITRWVNPSCRRSDKMRQKNLFFFDPKVPPRIPILLSFVIVFLDSFYLISRTTKIEHKKGKIWEIRAWSLIFFGLQLYILHRYIFWNILNVLAREHGLYRLTLWIVPWSSFLFLWSRLLYGSNEANYCKY